MKPPKNGNCHILIYTPDSPSDDFSYRKVPISDWDKITDATHWQPCLPPQAAKKNHHAPYQQGAGFYGQY